MTAVSTSIDLYKTEIEKDIETLKKKVAELENIIKNDGVKKKRGPKSKTDDDSLSTKEKSHEISELLFFDYENIDNKKNNDAITSIIIEKGYKGNNAPIISFNKSQLLELYNNIKAAKNGDTINLVNYDVSEYMATKDSDGDWAVNYE
jgi:hypothetical protein